MPEGNKQSEPYFYSDIESALPHFNPHASFGTVHGLGLGRLLLHISLFLVTCVTTTISGAIFPLLLQEIEPGVIFITITNPATIANGLLFSFTLLTILGTHELGHYIACRYYG